MTDTARRPLPDLYPAPSCPRCVLLLELYRKRLACPSCHGSWDAHGRWLGYLTPPTRPALSEPRDLLATVAPIGPSGNADFPAPPPLTSAHVPDLH